MPFSYSLDDAPVVRVCFEGRVDLTAVRAGVAELMADPRFHLDMPVLVDARKVSDFALTPDDLVAFTDDVRSRPSGARRRRRAVVASRQDAFTLLCILEALTAGDLAEYRTFHHDDARRWLLEEQRSG